MGSLSFAEIMTIVVVILIIFGPNRLPEFAKRVGSLLSKARQVTSQFAEEMSREWGEAVNPITAARDDLKGIRDDLRQAGATFTSDLGETNLSGSDPARQQFETGPSDRPATPQEELPPAEADDTEDAG
ncbi:MAG: twin-arginine translocase TatA/TatE family subunit [Acidimicrobiia bacterium]